MIITAPRNGKVVVETHVFNPTVSNGQLMNSCVRCGFKEENQIHLNAKNDKFVENKQDAAQERELAKLEGRDPDQAAAEILKKQQKDHFSTKPLGPEHEQLPGQDVLLATAGPPKIGTWCLWCDYISKDTADLESHMKGHVQTGYTPTIPLNRLLKWLGNPVVGNGGGVNVQIITGPANDITKKVPK